ncbi:MAG: AAA family ATPase, partial [bacterium]|nr:AAA family ATPase [bacterium]
MSRLFITGVSPVTLDDVTSGFNIGLNVSTEAEFNEMLGFTQNDVAGMLDYYKQHKNIPYPAANLMDIMNTWYNNYCFAGRAETRLFNSDMVLYFIGKCVRTEHIPDELIDHNVRIDYRKLRHLVMIDSEKGKLPNGNFDRLKQIIEKGTIRTNKIVDSFPVEQLTDTQNFISLLFYFGLLTIKGLEYEQPVLQIPNETVKQLYFDYIQSVYRETGIFSIDLYEYEELMLEMAYKGNWKPLFKYLAGHMTESMSLRDLITGEKSIQAFLNVYLALT